MPGHFADFLARHAGDDGPGAAGERLADAVIVVIPVIPELRLAWFAGKLGNGLGGTFQGFDARRWNQPGALVVEQRQRAGRADAEALEVIELGLLRIGVIEPYEQRRNDLAAAVADRAVLGHVIAIEQHRFADIALPGDQALVGCALAVQHGADGAGAILLAQGGADPDEVVAAAHENGRDAGGHRAEFIDFGEVVVQRGITQEQAWRGRARHGDRLVGLQAQAIGEAFFEQATQALSAVAQRAVESVELVSEESGFTRHVLFTNDQVGRVQRPQREQGTTTDNHRQDHGQSNTKLRSNSGTRLGHRDSVPNDWSRRVRGLPFS